MVTFTISEEERQAILLAIAKLAHERPGWVFTLGDTAEKLHGRDMFEEFLALETRKT